MKSSVAKGKDFVKETLDLKGKITRLPLVISLLYILATLGWILFEHTFLPDWDFVSKDVFWAVLSAVSLFFIARYGVSLVLKSRRSLEESEERLSHILETSASGILVVDRNGFFSYANLEASALLGIPRSDLVGKHYTMHQGELTTFSQVVGTGKPLYGVEQAVSRRDGSRVILSVNTAPLLDANGKISGMIASFFDVTARREAEDFHLRKLYLAAEQSPTGIAITDAAGRIEYANPMFACVTGYVEEELQDALKPCPDDLSAHNCREIGEAIASGREWNGEFWNRRRNGELYWESSRLTPIRDPKGRISNFLWVAQDVTEHRLAEDALHETRQRYQNLVEKVHDLVWEIDENMVFTFVSPRMHELLGYHPEEVIGKTPFDLMPALEAERVEKVFRPVADGRLPFEHVESILRSREGRDVFLTTSGVPFFELDGTFRGWRGVSRDISRLKEDEEALRRSEKRFREIFEQNEEAVIIFRSGTSEILDANPAAVSLYGYGVEEMREGGPSLFVEPGERVRFEQEIRGIVPGKILSHEQARHIRKDGSPVVASIRGKSIDLSEGRVSYCTFRDITARIRAEEKARERQAQLIHANRMTSLGTLVSGVAHEINNPNNLIMFNSPMIKTAWRDADRVLEEFYGENGEFSLGGLPYSEMRKVVPKLLDGVSDSSIRIRDIVEKLKNFARRDRENLECMIDINKVIRASLSILDHEIGRRCRDFRVDLAERLPRVRGCAQQLEQVMVNLVMNALQALPEKKRGIRISSVDNKEREMVEVFIRDEGVGMSADVMKRITEPFFSTKLDSGGLGLGLSISNSIVRDHNGTLDFESEIDMGTTARLRFPSIDTAKEDSPEGSFPRNER